MKIDIRKLDIALANVKMPIVKLSEKSGVSRITISRYRAGTQKARPQSIGKLATALGVKVEDLIVNE